MVTNDSASSIDSYSIFDSVSPRWLTEDYSHLDYKVLPHRSFSSNDRKEIQKDPTYTYSNCCFDILSLTYLWTDMTIFNLT